MTILPVNIDDTYPDETSGDALHQQHHDVLHALNNVVKATSINVLDYGAVGDGVTDDTAAIQAAIDAAAAGGGGVVSPAGDVTYVISDTIELGRDGTTDAIVIDFGRATFLWAGGAVPMFTWDSPGGGVTQKVPWLGNVRLDGAGVATCGFEWTDAPRSVFFGTVEVFDINGPAWHLRNVDGFSENSRFEDVYVRDCEHVVEYSGAADTGGAGTDSFARHRWLSIFGGDLTGSWVKFNAGASVYDSRFDYIKGNLGVSGVAVIEANGGKLEGTRFDHVAVESSGATGCCVFDLNGTAFADGGPETGGTYKLSRNLRLERDGNKTLLSPTRSRPSVGMWLPGTSGNGVKAPDSAALDITGDLAVLMHVRLDDYGQAGNTIASKWTATGNQKSWRVTVAGATRQIKFEWSADGSAITGAENLMSLEPPVDGEGYWFAVVLDVNRSGGHSVQGHFSDGPPEVIPARNRWSVGRSRVDLAGTTSVFASTADLWVGSIDGGTSKLLTGVVNRVVVCDAIFEESGNLYPDLSAIKADWSAGALPYRDLAGNVWTSSGSGWAWSK